MVESRTGVSAAVFDDGAIGIERLTLPPRGDGEIDVAITTGAICGSDMHTVLGHRSTPPRTVLGHEGVGVVVDVDNDRVDLGGAVLVPGDRVVFGLFSACGRCDRCLAGIAMKCRSLVKYGHESVDTPPHATGTLADLIRLMPGVPLLRVPDGVDDVQVVSAGCAVATAAAVIAAAGPMPAGTRVLVFGAGAVGTYATAMLTDLGCQVSVRDPAPERLAVVEQLGGQVVGTDAPPFPVVIEASGHASAFEDALKVAAVGGRVIAAGSVSPGHSTVTFDPARLVTRRVTLVGIHNYSADDFRRGVEWLLRAGLGLGLEKLVSAPYPLSALQEAFDHMATGRHTRVLVRPGLVEGVR